MRAAEALRGTLGEALGEQQDAVSPRLQRRELDREDVKAIEMVFAELAVSDGIDKIAVGDGDHTDIHAAGLRRPDRFEFAILQDAQQLGLQLERQATDLVQQDRAAVAPVNAPLT